MPLMASTAMAEAVAATLRELLDQPLQLVLLTRERVSCPVSDCLLCGGLTGGIMFPELTDQDPETLTEIRAEHEHWKFGDRERFRTSAHRFQDADGLHVVPDDDRPYEAAVNGDYLIAVYDSDDVELLRVDVGFMQPGNTLSTLRVLIGELLGA
jgi:hypothetical protein